MPTAKYHSKLSMRCRRCNKIRHKAAQCRYKGYTGHRESAGQPRNCRESTCTRGDPKHSRVKCKNKTPIFFKIDPLRIRWGSFFPNLGEHFTKIYMELLISLHHMMSSITTTCVRKYMLKFKFLQSHPMAEIQILACIFAHKWWWWMTSCGGDLLIAPYMFSWNVRRDLRRNCLNVCATDLFWKKIGVLFLLLTLSCKICNALCVWRTTQSTGLLSSIWFYI